MKGQRNVYANEGDCLQHWIAMAAISPTEMLYGWGKGVLDWQHRNKPHNRDATLRANGLAPVSGYPACDWCGRKQGHRQVFGRWWMHRACWLRAEREAPATTNLPAFTNWRIV